MVKTRKISDETLHRLQQRAEEESCSVDELVIRLLDESQKDLEAKSVAEDLYRLMAENSQDAISLHTPAGLFLYVNPANERLTGYTVDDLMGMTTADMTIMVHPDDLERTQAEAYQSLLEGKPLHRVEYRLRRKDGSDLWVENWSMPLLDENGNVQQILATTRDITERKQAQKRELELTLEKERVHLLTNFIQNVTHEFRTPLSIISTSTHLMVQRDSPDERQIKAEQIQHQVWRIANLVDMLLEMVRLESGDVFIPEIIDIGSILRSVCQDVVSTYGPEPILNYRADPNLPKVQGVAYYLAMAFKNLLDNAFRFTPRSGTINVRIGATDGHVWWKICDTGMGIAPEVLPDIFKAFWRQNKALTTSGFGLGLAITQKIIKRHGGEITVESEVGKGTCFRVTLPVVEQ